jgi:hypothetical protein
MDSTRNSLHLQGKRLWFAVAAFAVAALIVLVIIIASMSYSSSGGSSSPFSANLPQTDQQLTAAFGPNSDGVNYVYDPWSSAQVAAFDAAWGAGCLATEIPKFMTYWEARQVTAAGITASYDFTNGDYQQTLMSDYGQSTGLDLASRILAATCDPSLG